MNEVFIVLDEYHGDAEVVGIFSSKENAEEYCRRRNGDDWKLDVHLSVDVYKLDPVYVE